VSHELPLIALLKAPAVTLPEFIVRLLIVVDWLIFRVPLLSTVIFAVACTAESMVSVPLFCTYTLFDGKMPPDSVEVVMVVPLPSTV
jgi:hypothetical protein